MKRRILLLIAALGLALVGFSFSGQRPSFHKPGVDGVVDINPHIHSVLVETESVVLSPAIVEYNKGALLYSQGNLNKAIPLFRKAIELDPEHTKAHELLALAHHDLGQFEAAENFFEKALALRFDAATHHNYAFLLTDMKEFERSLTHSREAVKLAPEKAHYWLALAQTAARLQQSDTLFALEKVTTLSESSDLLTDAGQLYQRLGKREEAKMAYEKALQITPDYQRALKNLQNIQQQN